MRILRAARDCVLRVGRNQALLLPYAAALGFVAAATLLNLLAWPGGSDQDGHHFAWAVAVLVSALYKGAGLAAPVFVFYAVATVFDIDWISTRGSARLDELAQTGQQGRCRQR
jgi:hypothetical protein